MYIDKYQHFAKSEGKPFYFTDTASKALIDEGLDCAGNGSCSNGTGELIFLLLIPTA